MRATITTSNKGPQGRTGSRCGNNRTTGALERGEGEVGGTRRAGVGFQKERTQKSVPHRGDDSQVACTDGVGSIQAHDVPANDGRLKGPGRHELQL